MYSESRISRPWRLCRLLLVVSVGVELCITQNNLYYVVGIPAGINVCSIFSAHHFFNLKLRLSHG